MKKILTSEEALQVLKENHSFLKNFEVALNGLGEKLPAECKAMIDGVKAKANDILKKMEPIDQIQAGQEMVYALNSLAYAAERWNSIFTEMQTAMDNVVSKYTTALNEKQTAVNGLVEKAKTDAAAEALVTAVKEGRLFEQAKVDSLVEAARGQGRELALNEVKLISERKKDFAKCNLPLPADDKAFAGEAADYEAFKGATQDRLGKVETMLKGKSIALNAAPDLVSGLVFSANFETELANANRALALNKGEPAPPAGDPLIGGKPAADAPRRRMVY